MSALALPLGQGGVVPAAADCIINGIPVGCTSPTPSPPKPSPSPPKPSPTKPGGGGGGGGGGSGGVGPPPGTIPNIGGVIGPSGTVVGQGPGPATPPNVSASSIEISSDPATPGPGETAILTISASGTRGLDKYGVKDVKIDLKVTDSPGTDAKVDPASVSTDAAGTATAKFTTSRTKGRNAVTATAGAVTSEFDVDTLLGSAGPLTRGRHSGNLDPPPLSAKFNPIFAFAGAALVMVLGFLFPYRRRLIALFRRPPRGGPPAPRRQRAAIISSVGATIGPEPSWPPSSTKKSRGRRKSAAPGG